MFAIISLVLGILIFVGCSISFFWFCFDDLKVRDYPVGFQSYTWKKYNKFIFSGMLVGLLFILIFFAFQNK